MKSKARPPLDEREGDKARKAAESGQRFAKDSEVSYTFQKTPWKLTKILLAMLCIVYVLAWCRLLWDVFQWRLINLSQNGLLVLEDIAMHDRWHERIALIYVVWVVVTGIIFLFWVNQVSRNCHGFNALSMRYTPVEAVCYYLVPIICLYRPYWVMRELWEVSCNPQGWEKTRSSAIVGVWWGVHLITLLFALLSFLFCRNIDSIASAKKGTIISMLSNLSGTVLVVLLMVVVAEIIRMQRRLVNQEESLS